MIVLLEAVHPDAHALLERSDEVRVMASPTELDDDLPLDGVRAVLTRGRGRITAGDSLWSVKGPDMPAGSTVRVVDADGTVLIVEAAG